MSEWWVSSRCRGEVVQAGWPWRRPCWRQGAGAGGGELTVHNPGCSDFIPHIVLILGKWRWERQGALWCVMEEMLVHGSVHTLKTGNQSEVQKIETFATVSSNKLGAPALL